MAMQYLIEDGHHDQIAPVLSRLRDSTPSRQEYVVQRALEDLLFSIPAVRQSGVAELQGDRLAARCLLEAVVLAQQTDFDEDRIRQFLDLVERHSNDVSLLTCRRHLLAVLDKQAVWDIQRWYEQAAQRVREHLPITDSWIYNYWSRPLPDHLPWPETRFAAVFRASLAYSRRPIRDLQLSAGGQPVLQAVLQEMVSTELPALPIGHPEPARWLPVLSDEDSTADEQGQEGAR